MKSSRHRPLVVLVDDEDNIVLALHRVLYQDNNLYDVLLAKTAETAQHILRNYQVDVMVTDVHLPGMSGMDLLSWAAVESPRTRVIVMTAFDVTNIKDRAQAVGCLRLARKPFDVHEMRATIKSALEGDGFTGSVAHLSPVDVLQMLCICRKTTALRLTEGDKSGVVVIENGDVVHAAWNNLVGEDAFFEMMTVTSGHFNTVPPPADVEHTIAQNWQGLLMDAMRRQDETARDGGASISPRAPRSKLESVAIDRLIDQGFSALKAGDHDEALRLWEEGLRADPSNRMLSLNLRKLKAKLAR